MNSRWITYFGLLLLITTCITFSFPGVQAAPQSSPRTSSPFGGSNNGNTNGAGSGVSNGVAAPVQPDKECPSGTQRSISGKCTPSWDWK